MQKNVFTQPEISQVKDLTLKLAKANKQLSNEHKIRNQMLANISHDLRAPMTAIRNAVDYLNTFEGEEMPSSEEFHSIVAMLDRRSTVLENLIQDLFYLTSLDNPSHRYSFERVNMKNFLKEYYIYLLEDSRFKTRKLEYLIGYDLEAFCSIDIDTFTRTLDNLFINAFKYSNEGDSIKLDAYIKRRKLVICIEDTGIGIAKEDVAKIFDRSYTVSNARTPESVTGSGLGLAIVKSIIEHHKGKVYCESELGVGSKFFIELPLIKQICEIKHISFRLVKMGHV